MNTKQHNDPATRKATQDLKAKHCEALKSEACAHGSQNAAKGVWDEKNKKWIRPSGTVKQGRRPMFQAFDEDDTCPKCGSSACTHVWELDAQPQPAHSPLPWLDTDRNDNPKSCDPFVKIDNERSGIAYVFGDTKAEREANAKLIVSSVNHAEALAEKLRQCLHTLPLHSSNPVIRQIITESWQTLVAYEKEAR